MPSPQTSHVSRKQRLREKNPRRHAELIRVATAVFADEGYAAASVNRVAELAGVGVGTLYSYFDDKADLFLECVRQAARMELRFKRERLDPQAPALKQLCDIVRLERELCQRQPRSQALLKSVFYGVNSQLEVSRAARSSNSGNIDLLQQALRKGVDEGVFALGGRTRLAALLIAGAVESVSLLGGQGEALARATAGPRERPASEPAARPATAADAVAPHADDQAVRVVELLCRGILADTAREQFCLPTTTASDRKVEEPCRSGTHE